MKANPITAMPYLVLFAFSLAAFFIESSTCGQVPATSSTHIRQDLEYFDTNFENASPAWYDVAPDGTIVVHLLYDHERNSPNRAAGHIHFRLVSRPGTALALEFRNLDNIYNGRPGSVANELGTLVTSTDGINWTPMRTERIEQSRIRLAVTMQAEQLYVARVEPYRVSDLTRMLDSMKSHPGVSVFSIGQTVEKRELEIIRLGNEQAPYHLFLRGRAHPWESGGNWILEGFIRRLLRSHADTDEFFKSLCVWILPMANKDGVARGLTRFNLRGKDLNRNWDKPADPILSPENFALEKWLQQRLSSGGRIHFAMEIHNDGNGKLHLNSPQHDQDRYLRRMEVFEGLLRKHTWFTEGTTKTMHSVGTLANGWQDRFGIDGAVHEFNCQWIAGRNEPPTSRHWKQYGEGLANVFFEFFTGRPLVSAN